MSPTPSPSGAPASAATGQPRAGAWVAATAVLFFSRAFLFSTWVARGPEVKHLLGVDTLAFGLVTMLYPVGGLLAIGFADRLVARFGARPTAAVCFGLGAGTLVLLGPVIAAGNVVATGLLLVAFGAPMAIGDFLGNYEGTRAERAAGRSVFSAIHGGYGVGMLLAAGLAGVISSANWPLAAHFLAIGVPTFVVTALAIRGLPGGREHATARTGGGGERQPSPWTERRSLTIALVGFSFIMAEMTAGTWVPIALTGRGSTDAEAAYALSLFWIVVTAGRLLGGVLVDFLGRHRAVLLSALVTAGGLGLFMAADAIPLPWLGLVLWGGGMAIGFPMSVASMGDDPVRAAARINMIVTIVYIASITVGPALGAVGQAAGLTVAFGIPLVLLLVAAALSRATAPLTLARQEANP